MAPDPLDVLRHGLENLRKHIQYRKKTLQSRLSQKQTISAEDSDNSGDDDGDDDANFEPRPTRREALGAVSTLLKYTASMDDNFARKMEQLLSSFGRQTQLEETNALVTVPITQFFDKVA
jgi:hypothetical protein